MQSVTRTLSPRAPFDFDKSLSFIGGFTPMRGEQQIDDTKSSLNNALRFNGQTMLARVTSTGTAQKPELRAELLSETPIADDIAAAAFDRIGFYLSIDDDLLPFYAIGEDDPPFVPVIDKLYGYHHVKFPSAWENAVWAILTARNRMAIASAFKRRLVEKYGSSITVDGQAYSAFPEPHDLLEAAPDDLLPLVGNRQRATYLHAVIHAFAEIDEHWLKTAPPEKVEAWLRSIKGIGEWSASFILIRGLGRMERIIVPEERLIDAIAKRYNAPASAETVKKLAKRYGALQGYWAHYIRVANLD